MLAHLYRRASICMETLVTRAQIDLHMTRKGSQPLGRRCTICYTRGYKKYKVSLRMWEMFRQRTNINVPAIPSPVSFGAEPETEDVPISMPPRAILDIL